nr:hypothetical protein [uncultured Mucilaginibacter sp.]
MKYICLKLILSLLLALLFLFNTDAQIIVADSASKAKTDSLKIDSLKKIRAENIFIEAGGAGWWFTLNYDTRFNKRRSGLGLRIGAGYFEHTFVSPFPSDLYYNPPNLKKYFTLPVQLNYLLGKKSHFAEFGVGTTFTMFNGGRGSSNNLFPISKQGNQYKFVNTVTAGYRYQPLKGGFNFRLNADIFYSAIFFVPHAGIGVGYTFKGKRAKLKSTESILSPKQNQN